MKGKTFIVIMAIFIILCSIQATSAFEDNNLTQSDVLTLENVQLTDVIPSPDLNQSSNQSLQASQNQSSDASKASSQSSDNLLKISVTSEDILGAVHTPGIFVYDVDYDPQYQDVDEVPLERFFKAVYWGIRDYVQSHGNSPKEWDVFLCNKTFTGGYGDAGVGTIQTGYLSPGGSRVPYLTFNGLNYNSNIALTIHLYGGRDKDDGLTSTLDLTNYGADCAIIDFSTADSSITGINFKNFNVNDHSATEKPGSTVPFIKLGDASNPRDMPEALIKNCTFENITLNPKQPLYEVGQVGELSYYYDDSSLDKFFRFVFWGIQTRMEASLRSGKAPITEWNVYLNNQTFTGGYGDAGVSTISTGYVTWSDVTRATYLTFRNYFKNSWSKDLNVTIHLYGGYNKYDGLTSTLDLTDYGASHMLMDLSGGSSSITGLNIVNFNALDHFNTDREDTSMPFIFFGDEKISNYQSNVINCTFQNITLNPKQPILRMAFVADSQDSSQKVYSGGLVENCTFRGNNASQMMAISGPIADSQHSDDGPIFYGFRANNNLFENNVGRQEYDSNVKSLGFCVKVWNEVFNATFDNNRFINNTNAVHGAAYCIIGFNATITNNYIDGNEAVFGAGIEAHNGNITIKDCIFVNNVAKGNHSQHPYRDGSGAAIALLGCNNLIENCTFINNTAYGHAGAIDIVGGTKTLDDGTSYYLVADNTVIKDSRFYENLALDYAGGVHINGTNTVIDNSTFFYNNASHAGAVKLIGENTTIVNSSFTANNAIQGGAVYLEGNYSKIIDSIFTSNNATHGLDKVKANASMISSGGAIYLVGNYANVTNNTFAANSAVGKYTNSNVEGLGGAIYIDGENLTFNKDDFIDNMAVLGGGVFIEGDTISATVMNFTRNKAIKGGAVYIEGNDIIIDDSSASANTAVQGGAVYIEGTNTKIINSEFTLNNATKIISGIDTSAADSLDISGGVIDIVGSKTNVTSCTFNNNTAVGENNLSYGGAISVYGVNTSLTESDFHYNEAILGGAIYFDGTVEDVENTNFTHNNAIRGGAVYIANSNAVFNNTLFHNNSATHDLRFKLNSKELNELTTMGGAVFIPGNSIHVANSEFINNTAYGIFEKGGLGGAVAVNGSDDYIINSTFENNQAIKGGAFYLEGDNTNIIDSNFTKNYAIKGGVGFIDGSQSLVKGSIFEENQATHDGLRYSLNENLTKMPTTAGAIHIVGENINITLSNFTNNDAVAANPTNSIGAGAVYVEGNNASITECNFDSNTAIKGGAIFIVVNNTDVIDCNFTGNSVSNFTFMEGLGGAIYLENATDSDFIRCNFINNTASINGGAINWFEGCVDGQITECTFINNSAASNAGAIFWFGEGGIIQDSNFTNNRANGTAQCMMGNAGDGGAIMWTGSDGTLNNCIFEDNRAKDRGGAVFLRGVPGRADCNNNTFVDSKFINNTADVNGGAVTWDEGATDGKIENSLFEDNSAKANGGAVFWYGRSGTIQSSNFTGNRANGTAQGTYGESGMGGAVIWTGSDGIVDDCIFENNYAAKNGGAVYLRDLDTGHCNNTTFSNSKFIKNAAGVNGGAVDWHEGATNGRIENSTFIENSAKANGGAVFWYGVNGTIVGSNFTANRANGTAQGTYGDSGMGGAVIWTGSNGTVDDCLFENNFAAKNGGAVYLRNLTANDCDNNVFTNSKFFNNTAGVNGGAVDWHKGATNGRIEDSVFEDNSAKAN
ncbi:MAG: hypothetical protein IJH63_08100, partial [Methanobrevibacter sp.]|nr:hypothetical protein [Methanobrevibacter sp.]MBR0370663.1 hypothetical protein [Methanobrevibacter sp.]